MIQKIADAKKKTTEDSSRQLVKVGDKFGTLDPAKIVYDLAARQRLVQDTRRTIELGLQVSNWGSKKFKNNKVVIRREQLRGRSGMKWVPDLVVLDENKKEIYCVIYCLDAGLKKSAIGVLSEAISCFDDLNCPFILPIVIVRKDWLEAREQSFRFRFLEKCEYLFSHFYDTAGIRVHVLEFKPKGNTELLRLILYAIKKANLQRTGIKSIRQTLVTLAQEYPDLFAKREEPKRITKCAELLMQIQEQDPSLSVGQILCEAIQPYGGKGVEEFEIDTLNYTNDAALEKKLRRYLDVQK